LTAFLKDHSEHRIGTTTGTIQPASGVAGTSSACYPSHLAAAKFQ
jgi:hypothetical protein